MNLLKNHSNKYDLDHALVLTKRYKFEKGTLYLYGKLKLYNEIVRHHMDNDEYAQIIRACKKYGDHDPQLWNHALTYFASKHKIRPYEIIQILDNIDKYNLLPPLIVLKTLAKNKDMPLSVIRDYLIRILQQEQSAISADEREISRLQSETKSMKDEIYNLKHKATIFQGIRCNHCTDPLSLPAVHFLCMHSYHQRCLDNDLECPECMPEFKKVKEIKKSLNKSASHPDMFFKQMDESQDGFSTVAEYFGRGIFDIKEQEQEIEINQSSIKKDYHQPLSSDNNTTINTTTTTTISIIDTANRDIIIDDQQRSTNPFNNTTNPFDGISNRIEQSSKSKNPFGTSNNPFA